MSHCPAFAMAEGGGKSVQLATFLRWNVADTFGFETKTESGGVEMVTKVWCKVCAKHVDALRRSMEIRGKAKEDAMKFVQGTTFVTKHTVTRHRDQGKVRI